MHTLPLHVIAAIQVRLAVSVLATEPSIHNSLILTQSSQYRAPAQRRRDALRSWWRCQYCEEFYPGGLRASAREGGRKRAETPPRSNGEGQGSAQEDLGALHEALRVPGRTVGDDTTMLD